MQEHQGAVIPSTRNLISFNFFRGFSPHTWPGWACARGPCWLCSEECFNIRKGLSNQSALPESLFLCGRGMGPARQSEGCSPRASPTARHCH